MLAQVRGLSTGDSHVGNQGTNPGFGSTVVERTGVVHRCPPAIHRLSTGFVPGPGDNAETIRVRRPQNLQQEIHSRPQAVDKDVTPSDCPHRFPQGLSTSVRNGRAGYPPLGINPWGQPVDNVGTTPLRPGVDEENSHRRPRCPRPIRPRTG